MKPIRFVLFSLLILFLYACKKNLNEPSTAGKLLHKSAATWLISKYTVSNNSWADQVTYTYDTNNRLQQSIRINSGANPPIGDTLNYVFNALGQLHYTYQRNDTSFYSYDAQGRLSRRHSIPINTFSQRPRPAYFYYYKGSNVAGVKWYKGYKNLSIYYYRTEFVYNTSGNVILCREWQSSGRFTLDTTLFPTTAGTPVIEKLLSYDNHTNVNRFLNINGPGFLYMGIDYGSREIMPGFSANNLTSDQYNNYAISYNQDGLVKEIKVLSKETGSLIDTYTYEYKRGL